MVQRALVCDVWFKSLSENKQTNILKKINKPTRLKTILSENSANKEKVNKTDKQNYHHSLL